MSKGSQTRQRIVAQAARIFNQHGFAGGSISELMQATGLEKGGIYRHFSSKQELAAEAFDHAWQAAFEARMYELDAVPNSVDRLKRFVQNFIERRSPIPGGCPLLNTAIDADDGDPLLRGRARTALRQWQNRLSEMIRMGIKGNQIRRRVDAKKLATFIISSLEGALMVSRLEGNRKALEQTRSHLDHYFEEQVRA